jgi:hypothetical protein
MTFPSEASVWRYLAVPTSMVPAGLDCRGETCMKLSVVIPARNEAGNIGPTLDQLRERLQQEGIPTNS